VVNQLKTVVYMIRMKILILSIRKLIVLYPFLILVSLHISTINLGYHGMNCESNNITISIDLTQDGHRIKTYPEINCGPLPIYYVSDSEDLTSQYKEIGIKFIRTHDFFGPTDISTIFPDFNADPNLESSYNFSTSDEYINAIINAGCKVFYRLGESASDNRTLRDPPEDFEKWANICLHINMHYNDGWNNGYNYNIKYWEIWNEPDLKGFWNGTALEYYNLYNVTANTLKNYNNSLKIGGPCTSSIDDEDFTVGFLQYVVDNEIPLDFYSWHMYTDWPNDLYLSSKKIRQLLDVFGLFECENINTEWSINILSPQRDKDNHKNAAFTANALIAFQNSNVDYAFRYRGTQDDSWLSRFIGFDLSLFTKYGIYKTPALTYLAMHYISRDTPISLNISSLDFDYDNIVYLGGYSEDKTNISILISNYNSRTIQLELILENLSWKSFTFVDYVIDDKNHLEISNKIQFNESNISIDFQLKKHSVHLIRLTNTSSFPQEGPPIAPIPLILRLKILDPFTKILGYLLILLIFSE
jgi:hypothetical protein